MPKFFVASHQIQNDVVTIIGEDVNHIANVLRLQREDEIIVCDKDEITSYRTRITDINKEQVVCKIIEKITETTESNVEVTIFQGLPKSDKMEYIIQKATELGAKEIVPVAMKRCVVKLEGKDEVKKIDRWQKIAEVAAKQSGRDRIPNVHKVMKFQEMKNIISEFDVFIVAYEGEKRTTLRQILVKECMKRLEKNLKDLSQKQLGDKIKKEKVPLKIGVVIGPEGGLESQEVEELKQCEAKIITLGNRILRTETASLAILSIIMYELES